MKFQVWSTQRNDRTVWYWRSVFANGVNDARCSESYTRLHDAKRGVMRHIHAVRRIFFEHARHYPWHWLERMHVVEVLD